ncbi:MAG TPA: S-methyl-5-thioribose-1-phosphate isomerase [Candidatus Methanofastidiosa archaeon]|nr:S-methyl-5-thioribose-1-phosphate isomerase [Candidatus Methanofastidiosa archaeon]
MRTIFYEDGLVRMIDQTKLPGELVVHECGNVDCLIEAIKELRVRGAPALGAAGAYGVVLSARQHISEKSDQFLSSVGKDSVRISNARPTAVNLQWGVASQMGLVRRNGTNEAVLASLEENAERIASEDIDNNKAIGRLGSALVDDGDNVLTHCNAGALACVGYGTALGIIRAAHEEGKRIHVYVDETRPLCQGSRLTAWEMVNESIPATLITDSMAGFLMGQGKVQKVVVGADRIASNGDTANKIGTYSLSVLAKHHGIPMIVAAPTSTIDLSIDDGSKIPIEERDGNELRYWKGMQNAPIGIGVYNPAFDVTPNENITAIVTEKGVAKPPFKETLARLKS